MIFLLLAAGAVIYWSKYHNSGLIPGTTVVNPPTTTTAVVSRLNPVTPTPVPPGNPEEIALNAMPNSSNGLVPSNVTSQLYQGKMSPRFASPGIDDTSNIGVFNSGAGFSPVDALTLLPKAAPQDWGSSNPVASTASGGGIGSIFPASKPASSMRTRRRGTTVWGGFWPHQKASNVGVKSGGIVDTNTGVSMNVAGGPTQASSFVRIGNLGRPNRGMKLPQLPAQVTRGGNSMMPTGGGVAGNTGPAAPVIPRMPAFPSIFKVLTGPSIDTVTASTDTYGAINPNPKVGNF